MTTTTPAPLLDIWLAQELAVRERLDAGAGPGVARPDQVAGRTGLQVMQALLSGELPYAHMARTLDFTLIDVGPGLAIFQGTPGVQHLNPLGTVHGGWFATLLDSALGCAVHTMLPAGRGYTTADLSVKLVRAITPKVQRVRAANWPPLKPNWWVPMARCTRTPARPAWCLTCRLPNLDTHLRK
jgi:uncharacterized protein (TIGR00369 family)